jgi:hypothetical protein
LSGRSTGHVGSGVGADVFHGAVLAGQCIKYAVEKEVAAVISGQTLGNALRSSHMLELEDSGLPNARMVYPRPISEEEALN